MRVQPPLIILTCMRSFSSLISTMLGQHSGLYTLPEINPFVETTLARYVSRARMVRPRTLDGLYRAIAEVEFGAQTDATIEQAIAWVAERGNWPVARVLEHLGARLAPRRLIDKSPSTVLTDEALNRSITTSGDAYFLHLYRHPCATTRSIAKITKFSGSGAPRGPGRKDPEQAWYQANLRILKAAPRIASDRFMSVRGEDVLRNPQTYLPQICAWLGLETSKADMQAMLRPELSPYACLGPEAAPFGNDPNFLRSPGYTRRDIPEQPLSDPLDWDRPDRHLRAETIAISYQMGYCG